MSWWLVELARNKEKSSQGRWFVEQLRHFSIFLALILLASLYK